MGKLLQAMVEVAKPSSGATKILIAIARIARPSCDWIEGALRVELSGDETQTKFLITQEGGGVKELVYRFKAKVPFEEFARGLNLAPRVVEPLVIHEVDDGKIILVPKKRTKATLAPPSFEIAEESLRKSLPPAVRKSLTPKRPTRRPAKQEEDEVSPELFILSIPRTPKVLDLGEFAAPPKELKVRARKKP